MARTKKIRARPGCPAITAASLCTEHARAADRARGTSAQRGYGTPHVNARKAMARLVATGNVRCARCHQPNPSGADWHLDHDDNDRTKYIGASCAHCNLSATVKKSHQHD